MSTVSETTDVRVGVDLGGTGTRIVLVGSEGATVDRVSFATVAERALAVPGLVSAIRTLLAGRTPVSIGIGASGPVDRCGVIRNPATLPGFSGADLEGELGDAFDVPVSIDNDAVTAAIYEQRLGEAVGAAGTLMVTLGTGVGVAALDRGRPIRGTDGEHPEAGHRLVAEPTPPCYCGRSACWEQAVSRTALQAAAEEVCGPGAADALAELASRARGGQEQALSVFESFGNALGAGLADLQTVVRANVIVIGGSVAQFDGLLHEAAQRAYTRIDTYAPVPEIRFSRAGDVGGAIGAAFLEPRWYRSATG